MLPCGSVNCSTQFKTSYGRDSFVPKYRAGSRSQLEVAAGLLHALELVGIDFFDFLFGLIDQLMVFR